MAAFVLHGAGVIGMWEQLLASTPLTLLESLAAAAFIGIGSLLIIEVGVGNSPYGALGFYLASWLLAGSSFGTNLAVQLKIEKQIMLLPLGLATIALLLISIRHWLSPRTHIGSTTRLRSLERRPKGYTGLKLRLQSTGPALVDRIEVNGVPWERVVSMLFKQARYALIDVTDLSAETGLEWEIRTARHSQLQVLYLCAKSSAESVKAKLSSITGEPDIRVFEYENSIDNEREFLRLNATLLWFFRPDKARKLLRSYSLRRTK